MARLVALDRAIDARVGDAEQIGELGGRVPAAREERDTTSSTDIPRCSPTAGRLLRLRER
jgi:hypothetical protein